ncbi:hypothetical protein GGTG_04728 [Gaeumannomyces tritici R3-111a-1]|uniref:Uncharacterized protein n=1 Tax=Gaeumannomyces tritici (strain R3-111a-1) TaxID=644352 RepID=J3NTX9_GAET3|nr:hypothetical protein GGTG_04728 [Gaeumannomyces tritici R3-111a-1]EJT79644.1 hypothetical protein GGTG_04728 [Gaeumannomyces tritici R3-111a-1]
MTDAEEPRAPAPVPATISVEIVSPSAGVPVPLLFPDLFGRLKANQGLQRVGNSVDSEASEGIAAWQESSLEKASKQSQITASG